MAAITHETVRCIEQAHARGEDFALCEGGQLYVRGECGDCDRLAPSWLVEVRQLCRASDEDQL